MGSNANAVHREPWNNGKIVGIFDIETPRIALGRVVLLGDAAFVALPHVGAGVTKAALDAECLARDKGGRRRPRRGARALRTRAAAVRLAHRRARPPARRVHRGAVEAAVGAHRGGAPAAAGIPDARDRHHHARHQGAHRAQVTGDELWVTITGDN